VTTNKQLLRSVFSISISTVLTATAAWAFPFGPPSGVTTAPADRPGISCTACHAGTALNGGGGNVRISFAGGLSYTPGQTQNLSVVVSDSVAAIYGFEMTARLESGPSTQTAGSFTAGQGQKVVCSNNQPQPAGGCGGTGIQWIEHSQPSLSNTIAVQWTAPDAGAGNVHIYVSANAANGDNTPRGDHIYFADYVLTPASAATANLPSVTSVVNLASGANNAESSSWITITGTNFASTPATWDSAIITNVFPTTLAGVTVAVDGRPAPISFVNQTQINALVPATNTLGNVSVVVSNGTGSSPPATLTLASMSPGLFTFPQNQGRYAAAAVMDSPATFQYLAPAGSLGNSVASRAAKPGDTILLFATGCGPTTTPLNPEMFASVAYPISHSGSDITAPLAQVSIGGQAAQLQFIGMISPGLYQINAVVPAGVTSGDQPVKVSLLIGASTTQSVFVPIQ
jgi:uncharacterized protein (TIGR03437 family)